MNLISFLWGLPLKVKLYAIGGIIGFAIYAGFVAHQREIGRESVLLSQSRQAEKQAVESSVLYKARGDSLLRAGHSKDSLLNIARHTASNTVARYKTLHDTVNILDTLAVKEVLSMADSAISAGEVALAAADLVIANQRSQLVVKDSAIAAHERIEKALREQNKILAHEVSTPVPKLGKWVEIGAALVVGYEVGKRK